MKRHNRSRNHRVILLALLVSMLWTLSVAFPTSGADAATDPTVSRAQCQAIGLSVCPEPFDAVLPPPQDMLTWDQQSRVVGFRNGYRLYQGDVFHTLGAKPYPLPKASRVLPPLYYSVDGHNYKVEDFLRRQSVTGLLILKNGQIAYEYYGSGNTDRTLWTSRSVAKSVVSVLVGIAIKEKFIGSVTDPVTRYLPELKDTAWEGVTLQDLLHHTSGVAWNENYADPKSDFAAMTRCEAGADPYACLNTLVSSLQRRPGVKSGEVWSYNTGGAWLVGRVLERATGMTIAHYLETRVWSRYAMQDDGVWHALVKGKVDMGGHGFNATLRDWGRFALFVAGAGKLPSGEVLLPADWLEQSTTWTRAKGSVTPTTPDGKFGYQWWFNPVDPGQPDAATVNQTAQQTFWAEGIYGQALAIDPAEKLVMVQWSTWKEAAPPASFYAEQPIFFSAVAHALAGWN